MHAWVLLLAKLPLHAHHATCMHMDGTPAQVVGFSTQIGTGLRASHMLMVVLLSYTTFTYTENSACSSDACSLREPGLTQCCDSRIVHNGCLARM